jgi:predicted nucleic acid-binding protein
VTREYGPLIPAKIRLVSNYSLSFWDAMVIAACLEAGVTRLFSEDFDAYVHVDGLQIVNPFKTVSTS